MQPVLLQKEQTIIYIIIINNYTINVPKVPANLKVFLFSLKFKTQLSQECMDSVVQ